MVRYAMVIDQERCIGCHACAIACRVENDLADGSWLRVESASERMDVPEGVYPDLSLTYLPTACMHCEHPSCVAACPTEAIFRREDGLVLVNAADCNGCEACIVACPYDALRMNEKTGVVEKCTFCAPRLAAGLQPFCLVCCEGRAISFGDLHDPTSEVSRLLASRQAYRLRPEAGTQPSTYFCRPRVRQTI